MKDIAGFGRESAEKSTTTSNAFVRVTTRPVFEGARCYASGTGQPTWQTRSA